MTKVTKKESTTLQWWVKLTERKKRVTSFEANRRAVETEERSTPLQ